MTERRLIRDVHPTMYFDPPVRCPWCGKADLRVIDHRHPRYDKTASRDWRYEVTCDACLDCDANGYRTVKELLAEYPLTPANGAVHE